MQFDSRGNTMKLKLVTLAITSLVALNTLAATIDYRHEFKDTSNGDHKDRLLFSHRFEQGFGLSVEARWGSTLMIKRQTNRLTKVSATVRKLSPAICTTSIKPSLWRLVFR